MMIIPFSFTTYNTWKQNVFLITNQPSSVAYDKKYNIHTVWHSHSFSSNESTILNIPQYNCGSIRNALLFSNTQYPSINFCAAYHVIVCSPLINALIFDKGTKNYIIKNITIIAIRTSYYILYRRNKKCAYPELKHSDTPVFMPLPFSFFIFLVSFTK